MEIDGNDSLRIEHMEEIHIFHESMDLLISSMLNNNNHNWKPPSPFAALVRITNEVIRNTHRQKTDKRALGSCVT